MKKIWAILLLGNAPLLCPCYLPIVLGLLAGGIRGRRLRRIPEPSHGPGDRLRRGVLRLRPLAQPEAAQPG